MTDYSSERFVNQLLAWSLTENLRVLPMQIQAFCYEARFFPKEEGGLGSVSSRAFYNFFAKAYFSAYPDSLLSTRELKRRAQQAISQFRQNHNSTPLFYELPVKEHCGHSVHEVCAISYFSENPVWDTICSLSL